MRDKNLHNNDYRAVMFCVKLSLKQALFSDLKDLNKSAYFFKENKPIGKWWKFQKSMIHRLIFMNSSTEDMWRHLVQQAMKRQKTNKQIKYIQVLLSWCRGKIFNTLDDIVRTYQQPHYGNGVFGNVYLSAGQH